MRKWHGRIDDASDCCTDVPCSYFKDILEHTPDSIDSVTMDDQGTWSIKPAANGGSTGTPIAAASPRRSGEKRKRLLLDIDDDHDNDDGDDNVNGHGASNEGTKKAAPSSIAPPSNQQQLQRRPAASAPQIIDLTLSSSEDEQEDEAEAEAEDAVGGKGKGADVEENSVTNHPPNKDEQLSSVKVEAPTEASSSSNHNHRHGDDDADDDDDQHSDAEGSMSLGRVGRRHITQHASSNPSTITTDATATSPTPSTMTATTTTSASALLRQLNSLDSRIQTARKQTASLADEISSSTPRTTTTTAATVVTSQPPPMSPASDTGLVQWYSPNTSPVMEPRLLGQHRHAPPAIITMTPQSTTHGTITTTLLSSTLPTRRNILDDRATPPNAAGPLSSSAVVDTMSTPWHTPGSQPASAPSSAPAYPPSYPFTGTSMDMPPRPPHRSHHEWHGRPVEASPLASASTTSQNPYFLGYAMGSPPPPPAATTTTQQSIYAPQQQHPHRQHHHHHHHHHHQHHPYDGE
ncbi:hypothetical protein SYNPS1DRAFT_29966 [Syncephalis pseudoplumigaleata]|uniref:Uncharacterized protein n=1 Tax=Syncephalis pseudoplumigaleata TaxID=1712513 RepID=A0A4P9YW79_9FUNG|nr:hypothetical protein SYNPS1DRAFT_29966 [Syncephalis pseudoplumigaleata]|eukprot:RKP24267.1 hypothetical protein SYNPS1DRAFT_29966 [Syncephalis pseudoplumigaleata]